MECLHCKGRMVRSTAPFSIDRKGCHIVGEAIPAWVCTQCGEPFFEASEAEVVQRALSELPVARAATGRSLPSLTNADIQRIVDDEEAAGAGPIE